MDPNPRFTVDELLEHADWIRGLARMLVRDPATADDLVQETWIRAMRSPPRRDGPVRPWLATILRNLMRQKIRTDQRRAVRELAVPETRSVEASGDLVQRAEAQRVLVGFVLQLPEHYRSVVLLHFFEGLGGPEIAKRLGISEVTVRSRLKRGLDRLRDRCDDKFGDRDTWVALLLPLARGGQWVEPVGGRGAAVSQEAAKEAGRSLPGWSGPKSGLMALAFTATVAGTIWFLVQNRGGPKTEESASSHPASSPSATVEPASSLERDEVSEGVDEAPPRVQRVAFELLKGHFRTTDGRPLANVPIEIQRNIFRERSPFMFRTRPHLHVVEATATTDANGDFAVRLPVGQQLTAIASPPGFAPLVQSDRFAQEEVSFVFHEAATIRGRVWSKEKNLPISGAVIAMFPIVHVDAVRTVSTEPDGSFEFVDVPTEPIVLRVSTGEYPCVERQLLLTAGQVGRPEFALFPILRVRGTVRDATTGEPISGALVGSRPDDLPRATGADGRFEFSTMDRDVVDDPVVFAEGYGFREFRGTPIDEGDDWKEIEFRLKPARRARGVVMSEDGTPLAGARVIALAGEHDTGTRSEKFREGRPSADMRETRSDAAGNFEITNLRPDLRHWLMVLHGGVSEFATPFPPSEFDSISVDLGDVRVPRARSIVGVLLDEDGRRMSDAAIEMDFNGQGTPEESVQARATYEINQRQGATDGAGRFAFLGLPPGRVALRLRDHGIAGYDLKEVVIRAADDVVDVEWQLARVPVLEGLIRSPSGTPVGRAAVLYALPGEPIELARHVMGDKNGRFRIPGLPRGEVQLQAVLPPDVRHEYGLGASQVVQARTDGGDVALVMPYIQWTWVRVVDQDGKPVRNARVSWFHSNGSIGGSDTTALTGLTRIMLPELSDVEVEAKFPERMGLQPVRVRYHSDAYDQEGHIELAAERD